MHSLKNETNDKMMIQFSIATLFLSGPLFLLLYQLKFFYAYFEDSPLKKVGLGVILKLVCLPIQRCSVDCIFFYSTVVFNS